MERLTENPAGRLVSHPGIETGIWYVLDAAREVQALAAGRDDITVHVRSFAAILRALHTGIAFQSVLHHSSVSTATALLETFGAYNLTRRKVLTDRLTGSNR